MENMERFRLFRGQGKRTAGVLGIASALGGLTLASYLATTRLLVSGGTQAEARQLFEGELLENVQLASFVGSEQRDNVSLRQMFADGCGLLVFFVSTCPFCEEMAPKWAGVSSISTGRGDIRPAWIAVSAADTGATGFVRRHNLTQPWYAVQTPDDRRDLGINGWPTLYVVSAGGRFEGEITSRDPDSVELIATAERCLRGSERTSGSD